MPDLGNLFSSSSPVLTRCPSLKPVSDGPDPSPSSSAQTVPTNHPSEPNSDHPPQFPPPHRVDTQKPEATDCPMVGCNPFQAECRLCQTIIYPGGELLCSVRDCQGAYHLKCAKERLGYSSWKKFKCPQHGCYVCKQKMKLWRCVKCELASHDKCAAFPQSVLQFHDQPGRAICWRHTNCHLEKQHAAPEKDIQKIFNRLPIPNVEEEFKIDPTWKGTADNKVEQPLYKLFDCLPIPRVEEFKIDPTWKDSVKNIVEASYIHIRRKSSIAIDVYLVKKKRDHDNTDLGCTSCSTTCSEDCVCSRVQCISCSKACRCSEMCTNRPFRREKKIRVVKTELCGWGVEAAESINKGDFVIEYIGEVINDALCEQRLWDMKHRGLQNFYMCEIRKDFTIDATFKGNVSRFLNHSCDPNCNLEKWQVEGETRVGVFAAQCIKAGEPLTYDYRFVQFGPEVKCDCGASNCQGYLGTRRKILTTVHSWGSKRKRSAIAFTGVITV
ncbi:hypothetical protein RJ639_016222 [Escallonia herrerae]|uniref:Uncharacterized protein n=1 Tax=Escallonia herrerae TaxID=1293975 RepID=A0AA88VF74_9ASTE|nr:hypothetical protein RJ639_016222 [Escallonia herrerae]